jgi:hypothetical protein
MSIANRRTTFRMSLGVIGAGLLAVMASYPSAQQATRLDGSIEGTVASSNGAEAGVWVIAETDDLPTKFVKIVVTDDDGRYVVPDLPKATYDVWVRGYGLADSAKVKVAVTPGAANPPAVALKAVVAKSPQEAAKVYPANYWYSMLKIPGKDVFPGTGEDGNGIAPAFKSQAQYIDQLKQGCQLCHQLGNQATREIGHMDLVKLGLASTFDAWNYRTQTGQRGAQMYGMLSRLGRTGTLNMYADWTDRIAKGEVPPAPPRPQGVEQNVVVTLWDWGTDSSYMHDEISTAKANPTVGANGPVYAVSASDGTIVHLDPIENKTWEVPIATRDDPKTMRSRFPSKQLKPSLYWGDTIVHKGVADPHNPMIDTKGRIWTTSTVSQAGQPTWCHDGAQNKFAAYYPLERQPGRHASFLDPKTGKFSLILTCFGTHHLQFGTDPDETLYFSGSGPVIPWVNTRVFDKTGDEQAAQGWCPTVLDTNADGKITKPWNEPVGRARAQDEGGGGQTVGKFDAKLDTRVNAGSYGIIVSPTDQSAWSAGTSYPGRIIRLDKGSNPPESCMSEMYENPEPATAFGPRGIDVDRHGVVWMALSGSGGFASFDRRKCTVFNGPSVAAGRHCDQGWTMYPLTAGPTFAGTDNINADFHYYNWVDQFNTGGFGDNIPIATGSGSDSLLVLKPETKEWVVLRVPYPMGFFSRGLDGRIDDPNAGWKGRGLWANYGTNFLWQTEGGLGTKSKMVKFQVRPNPLAR